MSSRVKLCGLSGFPGRIPTLPNPSERLIMLPNEKFALECRAWYEEQGLVVDASNGEFAHCPQPERYGETGYYLLWEHHQHQGLLQSRDIGEKCFWSGSAKKWLLECNYFPENYFELWDIYEEYSGEFLRKRHETKDKTGKSLHAIKIGKIGGKTGGKKVHEEKDDDGKSLHNAKLHEKKDNNGRSIHALKMLKTVHQKKDENGKSETALKSHLKKNENGKSVHAVEIGKMAHEIKNDEGKSVHAVKTGKMGAEVVNKQIWESLEDGFRSTPGNVAKHNKARGWDPSARVRIA